MFRLYIVLALLGLSAIDPIGIGVVLMLLARTRPYKVVLFFLLGSFVSLMLMGILFAKGLGQPVLKFESNNTWFVPTVEVIAGVILLVIAIILYIRLKTGNFSVEPSEKVRRWLQLGGLQIFIFGGLLVAVQSIIDVVFVIAMIRVGQFKSSDIVLVSRVATYSIAALLIQIIVIGIFRITPKNRKNKVLAKTHGLLIKYSNRTMICVSMALSLVLFVLALTR